MNLLEMIDELKDTHDEELFKKTVDRLESLIYEEIRHSSDSEEANILEKEDYYYQELEEFIKTHGGRVSIDLKSSGYYGEIHNEKGQVVLPSPMPGRVTLAVTSDEEGKVEIDPESPIV